MAQPAHKVGLGISDPAYGALRCDIDGWQTIKRHDGDTLHVWIKHHCGEDIPQDLYYPNCQTDKDDDGLTPLMLWIEERPDEAIPQELYYEGYQTDRNEDS